MDVIWVYEQAIAKYGEEAQRRVAIEELSELIKELCKYDRGYINRGHIAEEIADVSICLEQLLLMFDCEKEVDEWRTFKLNRLLERLSE